MKLVDRHALSAIDDYGVVSIGIAQNSNLCRREFDHPDPAQARESATWSCLETRLA
jgi:hypothetical protein